MGLRLPCWGEEVAEAGVGPPEGRLWGAPSCRCSVELVAHASVPSALAVGVGLILALPHSVGAEHEGAEEVDLEARWCAPSRAPWEAQQELPNGLPWQPFL